MNPLTKILRAGIIAIFIAVLSAAAQHTPDANGIIYVRQGGTGHGNTWANATGSLQDAINAAGVMQVWVAKGTYQPASGQSFTMKQGVAIYGGFPNNNDHAGMDDRNWATHLTTLQGNGNSVVKNELNALTPADILDGFTITGGSGDYGGGIFNTNSSPSYINLVIKGNNVNWYGGGMLIAGASTAPRITSVLISSNSAVGYGGGVNNSSSPVFTNVTISGNTAFGGSEWNEVGTAAIRNSIIYGNGVNGQLNDVQNSLVQEQTNEAYGNAANHNLPTDSDPLFADPVGGNYSLLPESPVINKGKSTLFDGLNADTKDLAANRRLFDVAIDMGAYECQIFQPVPDANGIVYIRQGGTGDGSSWANATDYLQGAIDAAGVAQVWVAEGIYQPRSGLSFTMRQGVVIYGGFPDNDDHAGMNDRNWSAHLTTLRGNGSSVIKNEDNALTAADILDGFTITGGSGDYGGGILNVNSSPSYINLVITQNDANWFGGGMLIAGNATAPRITNVLISSNSTGGYGGGVNNSSSPVFTNVTISGNTAYGGSEWNEVGTAAIRNSIIYGNGVNGQLNDVQNSLVQEQTNEAYGNAANNNLPTDTDPLFTDAAGGNYRPLYESPVINKGNNTLFDGLGADTKDLVVNSRLFDIAIDMGAYECQILQPVPDANGIVYIRQGGTGDGSSWANATGYLQRAIDIAGVSRVWVAKGTYQPRPGQSFTMRQGVAIYGGFPDNDDYAGMNDRNWSAHVTTLKGNGSSVLTNVENGLTSADVLDGFTITGGTTSQYGGGIFNYNASPVYANLVITGNTGYTGGGIAIYEGAAPHLINVLISGNTASGGGGGVNASSPLLTNVTISGNTSSVGIGGAWLDVFGTAVIRNSIIYGGGVGGEQLNDIQNSLVQNQTNASYTNAANNNLPTNTDPLFTDPAGGIYTLQPTSPAVNKGSNAFFAGLNANTKDLAGNPRVYDFLNSGAIDMGAYESQVVPPEPVIRVVYVRQGGTGDGSSWAQAMGDFQGAIDAADVEQVWVAKGTYQPLSGRSFIMKRGVAIYGGFPDDNDNAGMGDRDWAIHPATLQGNGKCVIENENNLLTAADILDGFIITGGKAPYGAGIMNFNASPSYINLVITGNEATLIGGGIIIGLSAPRLTNVLVSGNTALLTGGVATSGSSPIFTNVTVSGNTASEEGAGEWFDETGTSVIRNSIIYGSGVEGQMENIQNSLVQNQTNAAYGDVANNNLPTDTDPLFTDTNGGDYSLRSSSPAINKGKNTFFEGLEASVKDLAGNPRMAGAVIDMGAFESAEGALPVRWISFEGRLDEQLRAVLTWTAEETDVSHYEVERSADAKNFHITGTVTAGGTGSGHYSHTDPVPVLGRVYYRIRQVDRAAGTPERDRLDGTFSYSRMISLAAEGRSKPFAYPNPARDRITVELGSEYIGSKVKLIGLTGLALEETEVKEEILTIDMSRYASGIYLLKLHDGSVLKLMKE